MLTNFEIEQVRTFNQKWLKIQIFNGELNPFVFIFTIITGVILTLKFSSLPATVFGLQPLWFGPVLIAACCIVTIIMACLNCIIVTILFYVIYYHKKNKLIIDEGLGYTAQSLLPDYLDLDFIGEMNIVDTRLWYYMPCGKIQIPFRF